jgi:competence protein ComEC
MAIAAARSVRVVRPHALAAGGARIEPLHPLPEHDPGLSTNDNSLVLRVTAHGRAMLLTGDLEGEGEILLAASAGGAARADVVKVPHHGSRTSSTDELLDAVRPRLAIASLGDANRFGFPHEEVVARYAHRGIRLLRTDRQGAVTIRLGTTLLVDTVDP